MIFFWLINYRISFANQGISSFFSFNTQLGNLHIYAKQMCYFT